MLKLQEYSGENQKIIDFIKQVDRDFYPPISKRKKIEEYVRDNIVESHYLLVVCDKERIVGSICVGLDKPERGDGYIDWIAILSKYRRRGLAVRLIDNVEAYLTKNNFDKVKVRTWSTNLAGVALYNKLGFSVDYLVKNERGEGIDSIYFVKDLP